MRICPVIGDVDGDGHEDMVQDIERFTFVPPGSRALSWEVGVLSGSDGRILRVLDLGGPNEGWRTHGLAAVGDWDGDGIRDYALARDHWTASQLLDIRSGRDDKLLLQLQSERWGTTWGIGLLGDIDLDGDGRPDLVLTDYGFAEPRGPLLGRFIAFANDGRRLYEVRGEDQSLRYWHSSNRCLGKIGDIDRDGADDYGIGVLDVMGGQVARAAGVAVISGKTGRRLYVAMSAAYPRDAIGHQVVGSGDWDADGVPDFVATSLVGPAVAFSGATGRVIRSWSGLEVNGSAMAVGDLDRDGM